MRCPNCQANESRVIDSRPTDGGEAIRRRRECENCKFRFTTFERIEQAPILVVKKDGTREAFDRDKLLKGITKSTEKRPVSMDQVQSIIHEIEKKVRLSGDTEVTSIDIGEHIMNRLRDIDEISYIRFASVYRQFKDMSALYKELENVMQDKKNKDNKGI